MSKHLIKSHATVLDFAFRKQVYPTSVYSAIAQGKIIPDYAGTSRTVFIDLRKYGGYKFRNHVPNKTKLIKWFCRSRHKITDEKTIRKLMGKYHLCRGDFYNNNG